jgi:hypothetical protein
MAIGVVTKTIPKSSLALMSGSRVRWEQYDPNDLEWQAVFGKKFGKIKFEAFS